MRPLVIAFVVLVVTGYSNMAFVDRFQNDQIISRRVERSAPAEKRDSDKEEQTSQETFNSFIEEKLMHQSQALEHLITAVDNSGDMIQKLIENLSKNLEKPNLPTKAQADEVQHYKQKHNNATKDNPIVKLGKNIPKYGKLAKDLILKEVHTDTDPTPLIEQDTNAPILQLGSRRSFGGSAVVSPSQQNDNKQVNPWCPLALLCEKNVEPVCGFDDEFGYGKFDDFCHMLRVNCYWRYNFAVVYSCSPKL